MSDIPKFPRRIVTGHKNGIATIIEDGLVDNVMSNEAGFIVSDAWATATMPVDLSKPVAIAGSFFPTVHPSGSLLRYVHIPPDTEIEKHFPARPDVPHRLMHQTETLDYVIILSGEVYLVMEGSETLLKPGDIVIQQATNHAWSNRANKPCIQLAILLDAKK